MKYIIRTVENSIKSALARNKSVLLLGARQTGKTTLLSHNQGDLTVSFIQPEVRQRYEKNPSLLRGEIEALPASRRRQSLSRRPLVLLDEVQKVPAILDVVQSLIDQRQANFILTGSSARKLRRGTEINLLPGRVVDLRLDPFTGLEFPGISLMNLLLYGSLPGIARLPDNLQRDTDLASYVTLYLEQEIRAEAVVRNLGLFARFLELAASESGRIINLSRLSQEIGVAHTTIAAYFQILEDCLIVERIDPIVESTTRKKLTRSSKYLFFDLGVRRAAAQEGVKLPRETLGHLFEQFVGLELIRRARFSVPRPRIRFWRDPNGPEIDWIIDQDKTYTPVEVKWTEAPSSGDVRHILTFFREYPQAKSGYLVCQAPRKIKLHDRVMAVPWQDIPELL